MSAIAMVSRFIMIEPKYSKSGPAIFIQQHLRLLQIARVEPLRKPPVNRSEQFACLPHLALRAPEARLMARANDRPFASLPNSQRQLRPHEDTQHRYSGGGV